MAYADPEELARILKLRAPTPEQEVALARVLAAAAVEIDHEIQLDPDDLEDELTSAELDLAAQVNLQRAAELWNLQEVPLGLAGIGSEFGTAHLARNSWEKYAYTLAPIKRRWGMA